MSQPPAVPVVNRAQMVEVDRLMTERLGVALIQMMENAGRAVATLARTMLGGAVAGRRVVVLSGPGGNGGGAMAAARRLHAWGALPVVVTTTARDGMRDASRHQLDSLLAMGVPVVSASVVATLPRGELVIDGILGYSLSGAPRDGAAQLIRWVDCGHERVLALDVPSGLDVDTGFAPGLALCADATVTLAAVKPGLLVEHASQHVGQLFLADIGVPDDVLRRVGSPAAGLFDETDLIRVTEGPW